MRASYTTPEFVETAIADQIGAAPTPVTREYLALRRECCLDAAQITRLLAPSLAAHGRRVDAIAFRLEARAFDIERAQLDAQLAA